MIPICSAPKRFVASLNKNRMFSRHVMKAGSSIVTPRVPMIGNSSLMMRPWSTAATSVARFSTAVNSSFNVSIGHDAASVKDSVINLHGPRPESWWTGKLPVHGQCAGVSKDGVLNSLPLLSLTSTQCTRKSVQDYYDNTWALTETLFAALQGEEAFDIPPYHDLRHPLIFYYGHPAVFYVNKLRVAGLSSISLNAYFESVFEVGVDEMSWDDLSKNKMPWPTVAEVHDYRKKVYKFVSDVIKSLPDAAFQSINPGSQLWAIVMAMEHERIHLETSSVLMSELPQKYVKFPTSAFPAYHPTANNAPVLAPKAGVDYPVNNLVPVAEKTVTLGKPAEFPSFGWDNEYGNRSYVVPAFEASQFKVSNGEFLEFVKAGGYSDRTLWSNAGWEWRAFRNAKWPYYWQPTGPQGLHQYNLRLIFDTVAMPWNWPVAVNFHEAEAFARWQSRKQGRSVRVLSELEHQSIRDPVPATGSYDVIDPAMSYQQAAVESANVGLRYSSMSPVDAHAPNSQGFYDVFGNAWEWMVDYFCALPGFKVHKYYEDFSTPCFDGLHNVIQGSSFFSSGNLASHFSRYHFRPHFLQHSSFRVSVPKTEAFVTSDTDAPGPYVGRYPYRRSRAALEAAAESQNHGADTTSISNLSYNFANSIRPEFKIPSANKPPMQSIFSLITEYAKQIGINAQDANVLEIGCGAGGLSFLLASAFKGVVGIDHSFSDIKFANTLRAGTNAIAAPSDAIVFPAARTNVEFRNADPMCVPAELFGFNVAVIGDILDKVTSPNAVLGRLGGSRGLVKDGGLLVVYGGYNWNENTTPSSLWLGNTTDSYDVVPTPEASAVELAQRLKPNFEQLHHAAIPFYWAVSSTELKCKLIQVCIFKKNSSA